MHIIGQILFGLVLGILAKVLMPAAIRGTIVTALIGMAGALVGTFIGLAIWGPSYTAGWVIGPLRSDPATTLARKAWLSRWSLLELGPQAAKASC